MYTLGCMRISSREPAVFCVICLGLLVVFQGLKNFIITETRSINWLGTTGIIVGIGIIMCLLSGKSRTRF